MPGCWNGMESIFSGRWMQKVLSNSISNTTGSATSARGRRVKATINALEQQIHVYAEAQLIKTLPLRGVVGCTLSYEAFVEHMAHQARAQHRLLSLQTRRYRTAATATP